MTATINNSGKNSMTISVEGRRVALHFADEPNPQPERHACCDWRYDRLLCHALRIYEYADELQLFVHWRLQVCHSDVAGAWKAAVNQGDPDPFSL